MTATGEVLDLERMRADVARVLECTPAEIGDDDNLIDLDLDSMRMLGLVLAWGNTGLPLEFSQLAEHTTLRQWWGVVQHLQAAQNAGHAGGADRGPGRTVVRTAAGTGRRSPRCGSTARSTWPHSLQRQTRLPSRPRPSRCALPRAPMASRCSGMIRHTCRCFRCAMCPPRRIRRCGTQPDARRPAEPGRSHRDRISQQVLFDLGGLRWVWYLRVHHLAADGYGMALFTDRVCALYAGRTGESLPGLAGVLADDAAYRADPRRAQAGQWWRAHMQGAPAGVGLAGTLAASDDALRWVQPLDAAFREPLLQASARWLQPWPDVLAALAAEYLRRMSAADEVVLGVPYMGRLGNASARVPAMVMNVLPLRVRGRRGQRRGLHPRPGPAAQPGSQARPLPR